MRAFQLLASWRWCLLAVVAVSCAHPGGGAQAEAPGARPGVSAQRRKEEKVRRLMVLTGAEDTGREMLESMSEQFDGMTGIPEGFAEKFREVASHESIVDLLVPVYMEQFTEEDLDAAIAFHESPAGQRFLAAQPRVVHEARRIGEQWGLRLAEKTLRALAEEQPAHGARFEGQQL